MAIPPSGFGEEAFISAHDITNTGGIPGMSGRADASIDPFNSPRFMRLVRALEANNRRTDLNEEPETPNEQREFQREMIKSLEEISEGIKHMRSNAHGFPSLASLLPHRRSGGSGFGGGGRGNDRNSHGRRQAKEEHERAKTSEVKERNKGRIRARDSKGRFIRAAEAGAGVEGAEALESRSGGILKSISGNAVKEGESLASHSRIGILGKMGGAARGAAGGLLRGAGGLAADVMAPLAVLDGGVSAYKGLSRFNSSRGHSLFGDRSTGGFANSGAANIGREALSGVEMGAGIGAFFNPVIGTAIGGAIGGAGGVMAGVYEQYQGQINKMLGNVGQKTLGYLSDADRFLVDHIPQWADMASNIISDVEQGKLGSEIEQKASDFLKGAYSWLSSHMPTMADVERGARIAANGIGSAAVAAGNAVVNTATDAYHEASHPVQMANRTVDELHYAITGRQKGFDPTILKAQAAAAKATGVSRDYLDTAAQMESAGGSNIGNRLSSAKGTYQFIDSTWRGLYKKYGQKYGLVNNPFDYRSNAIMGALYAKENAANLKQGLGRDATNAELYTAHFLGEGSYKGSATQFIKTAESNPNADAVAMFPSAAHSNPSIFYNSDKSHKTVAQVRAELQSRWDAKRILSQKIIAANEKSYGVDADGNSTNGNAVSITKPLSSDPAITADKTPAPNDTVNATPASSIPVGVSSNTTAGVATDKNGQLVVKSNLGDYVGVKMKRAGIGEVGQTAATALVNSADGIYQDYGKELAKFENNQQDYLNDIVKTAKTGADAFIGGPVAEAQSDNTAKTMYTKPANSQSGNSTTNTPSTNSSLLRLDELHMFIQDNGMYLVNMGHMS